MKPNWFMDADGHHHFACPKCMVDESMAVRAPAPALRYVPDMDHVQVTCGRCGYYDFFPPMSGLK